MSEKKINMSASMWVKHHWKDFGAYGGLVLCILIFSVVPPFFGQSIWSAAKLSTLMRAT